jgi:hypothetical protein
VYSHRFGRRVHEQADAHAQFAALIDQRAQARGIGSQIPAVVAGELAFAVGHEGRLVRLHSTDEGHQVVEGVALDVVLSAGKGLEHRRQVEHVLKADVPPVGTGMHRDALGAGLKAQRGRARDARNAQRARVAHQRHLVDVDRQRAGIGAHRLCNSIITRRVDSAATPQW